jgi:hypothetical protein
MSRFHPCIVGLVLVVHTFSYALACWTNHVFRLQLPVAQWPRTLHQFCWEPRGTLQFLPELVYPTSQIPLSVSIRLVLVCLMCLIGHTTRWRCWSQSCHCQIPEGFQSRPRCERAILDLGAGEWPVNGRHRWAAYSRTFNCCCPGHASGFHRCHE